MSSFMDEPVADCEIWTGKARGVSSTASLTLALKHHKGSKQQGLDGQEHSAERQ